MRYLDDAGEITKTAPVCRWRVANRGSKGMGTTMVLREHHFFIDHISSVTR